MNDAGKMYIISVLRELGLHIQKSEQNIFESCGSNNEDYQKWLKKTRYEFYKYLEMLKESAKNMEKTKT